jgi:CRP-like cAMP-binding protein
MDRAALVKLGGAMTDDFPRKLSHAQARIEQLRYWSTKSIPERLAAATALTRRMYEMRGINIDERKADFTPSRVPRRQS